VNFQNLKMLETAADHLGPLLAEVVFLGGATVELWISDPAAPEFRPTVDVDVVVEIVTKSDYYRFQDRVRAYVAGQLRELSSEEDFDRGLEGALPSSPESRERVDLVLWPRIEKLMTDIDSPTSS
jgi:hypothetical protein